MRSILAAGVCCLAMAPCAALARSLSVSGGGDRAGMQDSVDDDRGIGEIVVTARKRRSVPATVNAINADALQLNLGFVDKA